MDPALAEIRDFLAEHPPYQDLPEHVLGDVAGTLQIAYFRRGTVIIELGTRNEFVHIVRSGAIDIVDSVGALVDRNSTGDSFGLASVMAGGPTLYRVLAREDTLCYLLPATGFRRLMVTSDSFAQFFLRKHVGRLRDAVQSVQIPDPGSALLRTRLSEVVRRDPITAPPQTTVAQAARIMSAEGVSSLLITDGSRLTGILTDRDIRARVVAAGLPVTVPVADVMTPDPITIPADRLAMEALAELTQHAVNHVPVMQEAEVLGMVTASDLMRLARDNPTLLLTEITQQNTPTAMATVVSRLPQVVSSAAGSHAAPGDVARFITAVADTATRRVLKLTEADLGPAPMRYCWVALGSQGRMETGMHSDQDHALILSRDPAPAEAQYFAALAEQVVGALEQVGYPRCPGEVMASNPRWRVPADRWRSYLTGWINAPEPEAVLNAQIFFDMRPVSGDRSLFEQVRQVIADHAPRAGRFLAYLAKAAQDSRPPLGFFRDFVLEGTGAERRTLDVKSGALAQITQIARLSALALGHSTLGTVDRLRGAGGSRVLSADHAADLADAFEFLTALRTRHQVRAYSEGRALDSKVPPQLLSPFERRHLKNAFAVVRRTQGTLPYVYRTDVVS